MSDDTEVLTGSEPLERSLGFEPMPIANPVDVPEPDHMNESELAHFKRPEPPAPEVREYRTHGGAGDEIDSKYTVSKEQAAFDVANARRTEREALEAQRNLELDEALKAHEAGREQPAQQDQPQPETFEPQPETAEAEAARAQVDAAWQRADEQISEFLKDPHIRERIEGEFNQVKQQAAAEAKQEVERAHNLSAAVHEHYTKATNNLMAEASGIIGALYPELNGLSGERLQGALAIMQQTNPQRVQALQQLASRAQGLVQAQQRSDYERQQGQALAQNHELEKFTEAEVKRYEEAVKYENPETMKRIRESVYDVTERHYGINKQAMNALYTGQQRVDSAAFVRSAAFQLMLTDAVKYRLAQQNITQARSNPIPRVQRPGVAADGPRADDGEVSAAMSRLNLPGGNTGPQGIRNAAAWLTARRGKG